MDRETYEQLKPFDTVIKNVIKMDYLRLPYEEFLKIVAIYEKYYNTKVPKSKLDCNSCRLKIIKSIGVEYLAVKDKYETEQTVEEPKKKTKRGRPKKIDIE